MIKDQKSFVRGDIFEIFLPTSDMSPTHLPPKPDITLHGKHKCICLTSYDDTNVPKNQVAVIPISSATAAVRSNRLTSTHLLLEQNIFTFLDHDSYALIFQTKPVGTHWLQNSNFVCNIKEYDSEIMEKIGILSLFVSGAYNEVMDFAFKKFQETIFISKETT